MLFSRFEQRIDEIEKKQEETKELKVPNEESKDLSQQVQAIELNGIRSVITKQEICLNDLNLRLSNFESVINKLDPNNIRALIRDIAELLMQEERKGVNATMDSLKGTEKRNEHLMSMLKEELRIMDERFTQDIERKLEKSDLYLTKTQLQRKVIQVVPIVTHVRATY